MVRCSSYYQTEQKATDMPDTQNIATTNPAQEHDHESDVRVPSPSRRSEAVEAAAIEAAYILEAVRK